MHRRTFLTVLTSGLAGVGGCSAPVQYTPEDSPVSEWVRDGSNPVIGGNTATKNQAGFGGIIHARTILDQPIEEWYFYWAGHDGGGIWLSTAPDLRGVWTTRGQLFVATDVGGGKHVSSPYPVMTPQGDLRLYFHRALVKNGAWCQETDLVRMDTTSGTTVESQPVTVLSAPQDDSWDGFERAYMQVVYDSDKGLYRAVYQGRDKETTTPGLGYAESNDGREWMVRDRPMYYNSQVQDDSKEAFIGGPHLLQIDGRWWVFYQDRARAGDGPEGVYALPLDYRDSRVEDGVPVLTGEQSWTNGESVHVVDHIWQSGTLHLFYADSTEGREQKIGVATQSR